ncbi:hypothetical protein ALC53_00920 [Atta colombica]|uniref:Uncharacterized protein n=1 Tax=Atta colombica TaxID=520822 RepID=A0A195BW06_9HYME|nr:hypothetical protein ALC53_00920 [Atta colombica]
MPLLCDRISTMDRREDFLSRGFKDIPLLSINSGVSRSALLCVLKWTGLAAATTAVSIHEKKCRGGKIHSGDDAGRMGESRLGKESHATVRGVAFFLVISSYLPVKAEFHVSSKIRQPGGL